MTQTNTPSRPRNPLVYALYANAAILLAIFIILIGRSAPSLPQAMAQQGPALAGHDGIVVMPAQFAGNIWGCYILDTNTQTLAAYQYLPGERQLRLVAARDFRFDRHLRNFNTSPSWMEIQALVEKEQEAARAPRRSDPPALAPAPDPASEDPPQPNDTGVTP